MNEKKRDEITQAIMDYGYNLPPPTSGAPSGGSLSMPSGVSSGVPVSLEGNISGSAGSIDKLRRIDPDVEMRLRYRRAF